MDLWSLGVVMRIPDSYLLPLGSPGVARCEGCDGVGCYEKSPEADRFSDSTQGPLWFSLVDGNQAIEGLYLFHKGQEAEYYSGGNLAERGCSCLCPCAHVPSSAHGSLEHPPLQL